MNSYFFLTLEMNLCQIVCCRPFLLPCITEKTITLKNQSHCFEKLFRQAKQWFDIYRWFLPVIFASSKEQLLIKDPRKTHLTLIMIILLKFIHNICSTCSPSIYLLSFCILPYSFLYHYTILYYLLYLKRILCIILSTMQNYFFLYNFGLNHFNDPIPPHETFIVSFQLRNDKNEKRKAISYFH